MFLQGGSTCGTKTGRLTMRDISEIIAWLIGGAADASSPEALVEALCQRLCSAGVPLDRAGIFVESLHPEIAGRSLIWRRGGELQRNALGYEAFESERLGRNPVFWVRRSATALRRKLDDDAVGVEFALLGRLRDEGYADYFAVPPQFAIGETHCVSWATRQASGFAEADLVALAAVAPPLARVIEARSLRLAELTLLETYVGRRAGARVIAGQIRRGDTVSLHAAIWFSDLRGFTALSDRLPARRVIALLNRYFDCQVPIIDAHGGEVLKFMGDGLLAIFPTEPAGSAATCAAALAAARAARAAIVELAREMADDAAPRLPFGLALHVGDVLYGNVGGGSRLDFTVIGPAVNLASRLEHATRRFDRSVLVSAAFAALCGEALVPLGDYVLRGIALAQPVFGLPEEGAATIDATPPIVDS